MLLFVKFLFPLEVDFSYFVQYLDEIFFGRFWDDFVHVQEKNTFLIQSIFSPHDPDQILQRVLTIYFLYLTSIGVKFSKYWFSFLNLASCNHYSFFDLMETFLVANFCVPFSIVDDFADAHEFIEKD